VPAFDGAKAVMQRLLSVSILRLDFGQKGLLSAANDGEILAAGLVVVQFSKEASQTRDYCVARHATLRRGSPDPSLRKERLLKDDNQTAPLPPGLLPLLAVRVMLGFRNLGTRNQRGGSARRDRKNK